MRFYKKRHNRKIKKYCKICIFEYVLVFENSNKLIDFVCNYKNNVIKSSLYTDCGYYMLYVVTNSNLELYQYGNIVFKDKLHIDKTKSECRVICSSNALQKMQQAFKVI